MVTSASRICGGRQFMWLQVYLRAEINRGASIIRTAVLERGFITKQDLLEKRAC